MADSSPLSTPKRARTDFVTDESPSPIHTTFSFNVDSSTSLSATGDSSPRSKVAHRFQGLVLGDGGPAPAPAARARQSGDGSGYGGVDVASAAAHHDTRIAKPVVTHSHASSPNYSRQMQVDENEAMMRKRTRVSPNPDAAVAPLRASPPRLEIPDTTDIRKSQPPTAADATSQIPSTATANTTQLNQPGNVGQFMFDQAIYTSSPKPSPSKLPTPPSQAPSNRPVDAVKSRVRKRAGTPPLSSDNKVNNEDEIAEIIDPLRASLTWHEDEITVYDPEDEDDDGVGINGIGFKPTPAIAHARTMKRRQQLAEYRKREEREARARRNLRRRGSPERPSATLDHPGGGARKVHFTEAEPSMMIETI